MDRSDAISDRVPPEVRQAFGTMPRAYSRGTHIGLHVHREAQLLFACQGLMQVSTPKGCWFVPPERAVWLPPRIAHAVDVLADIEMRALLIPPDRLAAHPQCGRLQAEFVAAVDPLLREVILGAFLADIDARLLERLIEVALFRLAEADTPATFMPMPQDERLRRVAERILDDPRAGCSLSALAETSGLSARTLSRRFPEQTGLTLRAWRQRARIMAALPLLGRSDLPIKAVAGRLGFSSVAAFSHAFRQIMGMPPSQFGRPQGSPTSTRRR